MTILFYGAVALFALSAAYMAVAIGCILAFAARARRGEPRGDAQPPVTVLKPLCGLEAGLADNLRSFVRQDYGPFQIVFGVRDADDPAIAVVEALIAEFPGSDLTLVVDGRTAGRNLKVSNLANMAAAARHDLLVIADSDMRVGPDYLRAVVAPFARPEIGAATCLYFGRHAVGLPARLGAMFINDWFLPSALIATTFGKLTFCFGATMAVRREALAAFGGFEALAGFLADDYKLGQFVAAQGYTLALVPYLVENLVDEPGFAGLFHHELRWARTIRTVQPVGYALSTITETLPWAVLAAIFTYAATASAALAAAPVIAALALRCGLHYAVWASTGRRSTFAPWLMPMRDLLSLAARVASYGGRTVLWRSQTLDVRSNSRLNP